MKLLLFSDVHNDEKKLLKLKKKCGKADFAICAGDFTRFGTGMDKMLRLMNSFEKPVLLVHGNHENPSDLKLKCKNKKNIIYIHKKTYKTGDYRFVGHGGEGFTLKSEDFEKFSKKLSFKKGEKLILVTHQPPYKTKLDHIWDHHGNKSYKDFINKSKPVLAVCGHLHETAGMAVKIGRTIVANPGPDGMIKEV